MKFSQLEISVNSASYAYLPYDRGANGAFVYRESGKTVNAPRTVVSSTVNDTSSDRFSVQLNVPRVCADPELPCGVDRVLGTDLVKTEMRFLASTSKTDRQLQIDQQIALLQELRSVIEDRDVIYS